MSYFFATPFAIMKLNFLLSTYLEYSFWRSKDCFVYAASGLKDKIQIEIMFIKLASFSKSSGMCIIFTLKLFYLRSHFETITIQN